MKLLDILVNEMDSKESGVLLVVMVGLRRSQTSVRYQPDHPAGCCFLHGVAQSSS